MLPPVLEIHVLWHPGDHEGAKIAQEFVEHFHGTPFTGLIGGAIEVFIRSAGWTSEADSPRPIPVTAEALPKEVAPPRFVAIVPILGNSLASEVQKGATPWLRYLRNLVDAREAEPRRIGLFPYLLHSRAIEGTVLDQLLGKFQRIASSPPQDETIKTLRCRDLTQGIAQLISGDGKRLTVFISHTKRNSAGEEANLASLVATIREVIQSTKLNDFFDASDLQPGQDWSNELKQRAATSALLAVRTDLYPSRDWCQREMLISKRAGMPLVIMDAISAGEERGSFLMDHVPRTPARTDGPDWRRSDIFRSLNNLVDECLKRALWRRQEELAKGQGLDIAWWAPHAPEPITLTKWIQDQRQVGKLPADGGDVLILHPDPPLGIEEKIVLQEIFSLAGINRKIDVLTPRLLASRCS